MPPAQVQHLPAFVKDPYYHIKKKFPCSVADHRKRQSLWRSDKNNAPGESLVFSPHFYISCDLLLCRSTATWILFILYNKEAKVFDGSVVYVSSPTIQPIKLIQLIISLRIDKLRKRANAWNVSFKTLYGSQFTLSTPVDHTNYPVILSHQRSTMVSLETYPL